MFDKSKPQKLSTDKTLLAIRVCSSSKDLTFSMSKNLDFVKTTYCNDKFFSISGVIGDSFC